MSDRQDETANEQAGLFVGGSMAALRELVEPPRLSETQLNIIRWYNQLVQQLSGPRTGDERGPAARPPWISHPPRIDGAALGTEAAQALLVEGEGFSTTLRVQLDGEEPEGWQVVNDRQLLIQVLEDPGDEVEIEVSTYGGAAAARVDLTAGTAVE